MLVYRVENAAGFGPYWGGGDFDRDKLNDLDGRHPDPCRDGIGEVHPDDFFGFATLDALKAWFGCAFNELAASGYHLAVYAAPSDVVRLGGRQVAFTYQAARRMSVEPLPI